MYVHNRMGKILRMPRYTLRKLFSMNIKGIVYKRCVRSAMLYGSEICCLVQNERKFAMKEPW